LFGVTVMSSRTQTQAVLCFGLFVVIDLFALFMPRVHLGFLGLLLTPFIGGFFTFVGVAIGDAICRAMRPDLLLGSSSVELFKAKVFWRIGPQAIGWFCGFIAYQSVMRNVFGIYA
ncbi:hypothetical protein, partial [Pseudomonas sp. MWU12-2323]